MDSYQGDVPGMIQHARQALAHLPEQDRAWRSMIAMVLGDVYGYQGDMTAAYEARSEALAACQAAGDIYYVMLASMKLAITLRSQGRLQQTIEICQQQIALAEQGGLSQTSLVGLLLAIQGEVLAELNDLDGAYRQVKRGIRLAERGVDLGFLGWGYMCLIRILLSRGELDGALEIVQEMERLAGQAKVPPWAMSQMANWRARIRLAQGKLEAAFRWATERGLDTDDEPKPPEIDFFSLFDYILYARILVSAGDLDRATALLPRLLEAAEAGGRTTSVIEILLLQALAYQTKGDTDRVFAALERALTLAEPEGFIRIFVDEGPPMARLLYEALSRGIAPDYVHRLLAAFPSAEPEQIVASKPKAAPIELVEPLSERELEVLQLISKGLTNSEIASQLYLAVNTVKVHTRNIYGKLDVHNRTEAVSRARALGVLPTT
jgi:LuxR family maltose regulon positive regulatory protein